MATAFSASIARTIVAAWPKFDDDWQKSAAVGALAQYSADAIAAILDGGDASLAQLASILTQGVGEKNDTAAAAKLVIELAGKPASADALKRGILDTLGKSLKQSPVMSPELSQALGQLLSSSASGSVLPLAAKWDTAGTLKGEITRLTTGMIAALNNPAGTDEARFAAATSLLGLRSANPSALPAVTSLLTSKNASPTLQKWIVAGLGETNDLTAGSALIAAFSKLAPEVQTAAFDVLLKRADSALALLDAMTAKTVDVSAIGPANLARLRTHADKKVAERAGGVLDQILGPAMKAKNEAIAEADAGGRTTGQRRQRQATFHRDLRGLPQARGSRRRHWPRAHRHGHPRSDRVAHCDRRSESGGGSDLCHVEF